MWPLTVTLPVLAFALTCVCVSPATNIPLGLFESFSAVPVPVPELAAFAPYAQFARAAYCPVSKLQDWTCGAACDALPGFVPTLVGGDGNLIPVYFVGYWVDQKTIVVGHEGTDPTKLFPVLDDVNVVHAPLDPALFPGVPDDVFVHKGFRDQQALTAGTIFLEVNRLRNVYNTTNITIIGHSLGGALALLDSLFLSINFPESHIALRTFGCPRVGNPAFVEFFDSYVTDIKRVNNEKDPVPTVPLREWGFMHPGGEIHILSSDYAVSCSGDDNDVDQECTALSVKPDVLFIPNHLGPYDGIYIGTIFCY